MAKYSFLRGIDSITRPRKQGGSCIDHIFINSNLNYKTYNIHHSIPDHYLIAAIIDEVDITNETNKQHNKIDYKKMKK